MVLTALFLNISKIARHLLLMKPSTTSWLHRLFGFDPQTMTVKKRNYRWTHHLFHSGLHPGREPGHSGRNGHGLWRIVHHYGPVGYHRYSHHGCLCQTAFVLAPGMGLNAFFAYTIVLLMGYSWQFALTAVFLEGLLFILFTITGLRQKLVDTVPSVMHHAISAGIGLFLLFWD